MYGLHTYVCIWLKKPHKDYIFVYTLCVCVCASTYIFFFAVVGMEAWTLHISDTTELRLQSLFL